MEIRSEERVRKAVENKNSGQLNCAQSVACAFSDLTGLEESAVRAATSAFGSGMGNMEGTCGALTGAAVIVGLTVDDRVKSRATMKGIMEKFQTRNGCTICKCLKGVGTGKPLRSCPDCVADAAEFLSGALCPQSAD